MKANENDNCFKIGFLLSIIGLQKTPNYRPYTVDECIQVDIPLHIHTSEQLI